MCQPGHLSLLIFSDPAHWPQMAEGSGDPWGFQMPLQTWQQPVTPVKSAPAQPESKCEMPHSELRGSASPKSHQEPEVLILSQAESCKQKPFTSPR